MNTRTAENFMRSTKAPMIKTGVMTAKVNWNVKNTVSGIVPLSVSGPTPAKNILSRPPI